MRAARWVTIVVLLLAAGGVGYWAGRVALEPPQNPLGSEDEPASYVVETGTVGKSLSFTSVAEWTLQPAGENSGTGVVTSVLVSPGDLVEPGDTLYTVNLRPVVVADGAVPMFRTLTLRDEGADVAQLQTLLAKLGFYEGEVDGDFGASTRRAVKEWQDSLGIDDTGIVGQGDIVFIGPLPARIVLEDPIVPGARLTDGEPVVSILPADPVFTIPLAPEQADLVPLSAEVLVEYPEGTWDARIDRAVETDAGRLDLILSGHGGGSVCGDECADWVSLTGTTNFRARIVVIPETTGPVVPVGALSTDPANNPSVTLTDNTTVPVTIVASSNGLAVVDGIDPGTEVLLLVDDE